MPPPSSPQAAARRRGRPVDHALSQRIVECTLKQLSEVGYSSLEIESIAAAAHCSKTTIYRRWGPKGALVGAAIAAEYTGQPASDTGNLLDDLVSHVSQGPSLLTFGKLPAVAWTAMLNPRSAPCCARACSTSAMAPPTCSSPRPWRGASSPDADARTILHVALGLGLYRRFIADGEPLSTETLRQVIAALIASPPRIQPAPADPAQPAETA